MQLNDIHEFIKYCYISNNEKELEYMGVEYLNIEIDDLVDTGTWYGNNKNGIDYEAYDTNEENIWLIKIDDYEILIDFEEGWYKILNLQP